MVVKTNTKVTNTEDGPASPTHPHLPTNDCVSSSSGLLSAAGINLEEDDPNTPCLTVRMWTIGIFFCLLGCGINTLYTLRYPSVSLSQSAIQFLAFPLGKVWERVIPNWTVSLLGWKCHLNPGPFNHKENILIYIMANLSYQTRLSADVLTEQRVFFGHQTGWAFEILITLATILYGFAIAGVFKSIVVDPPNLLWPGVFGNTALNHALHFSKAEETVSAKWRMSRYSFFLVVFCVSFCWYWFPDLIFPALGYFTFICWIFPRNAVVNQIFGMKSGIGLLPLTFDWSQIAYVGSPLLTPSWAILNILASLLFWIYIVTPALYYSNVWSSSYLPIQSNSLYDNMAKTYNVTRVINRGRGFEFNATRYEAYSPIYLPVTYALNIFGLSFATISSLFIWILLEKRDAILNAAISMFTSKGSAEESSTSQQVPLYRPVPHYWFLIAGVLSLALAIFSCEYWEVQLPWYGVVLSLAISAIFFIPLAFIYGTSNLKINIDVFCRIIAGYLFEGRVLANVWFFDLGYITGIKGLQFAQDLKLGTYCGIPPRSLFLVQSVSLVVATISQVGVLNWALNHIQGVCTSDAANGFTCPFSKTHFNTSTIWGAIGPRRFFSKDATYHSLLYFFVIGIALPPLVFLLQRRYPTSFWKHVHIPLFLGGLNYLPPASGTNYGSFVIVGLVFGLYVRRHFGAWWLRYNFVLSSALDCSLAVAGVVIFFAVYFTGAADHLKWWGTEVYKQTCDWKECPRLVLGKGEKFGV